MKQVKKEIQKGIANLARKITETEVNSTCPLIAYQPKLPKGCEKFRKN